MEFFRYYKFYHQFTEKKIYFCILASLFSVGFQGLAAMFFLPVLFLGNTQGSEIFICEKVYSILSYYGINTIEERLPVLFILAIVCFFISSVGIIFSKIYSARVQTYLLKKVELEINKKLFGAKYEYFISRNIGFLNNAIIQQIATAAFSFKHYATIINNALFAILFLCLPFITKPRLALMMIIIFSPLLCVFRIFNKKNKHYSILNTKDCGTFNGFLLQMLSNYKYFKATAAYPIALEKLKRELKSLAFSIRKLAVWGDTSVDVVTPFAITIMAGLIYYDVTFNNSPVLAAITLLGLLYAAYQKSIVIPASYQKFLASIGPIMLYRDLKKELEENQEGELHPKDALEPDFSGPIVFKNLSFSYSANPAKVLENVNIEIPPKKSVAFVGESGSGKSTIVNLITGLLKPTEGTITLSGTDYKKLDIYKLRNSIGYVTQEPVVFNDTVRNNISLWNQNANMDKIKLASRKAHAHVFIDEMPEKYETLLGDSGINISGGERQRMTIARELLRDNPVLIMDEATSSLDSETEGIIKKSIDEYKGERTIIIIAHRLSTIKNCDRIYVLDKASIVEQGTYDELYNAGGLFKKMVDKQSLE